MAGKKRRRAQTLTQHIEMPRHRNIKRHKITSVLINQQLKMTIIILTSLKHEKLSHQDLSKITSCS